MSACRINANQSALEIEFVDVAAIGMRATPPDEPKGVRRLVGQRNIAPAA